MSHVLRRAFLFTWSQEQVDPGAWQSQDEPAQHLLVSRFAHRPTSIGPCIRPDKPLRSLATSRKRSSNRPRDGSPPGRVKASDSPAVRHSVLKIKLFCEIRFISAVWSKHAHARPHSSKLAKRTNKNILKSNWIAADVNKSAWIFQYLKKNMKVRFLKKMKNPKLI